MKKNLTNKSVERFRSGTKYGYQFEGTTILPAKYTSAEAIGENGYAQVGFNRKIGLVRKDGKEIVPVEYKDVDIINNQHGIVMASYKRVDLWLGDEKFILCNEFNDKEQEVIKETDDGKTMSEFVAIGTEDYLFEGKITILSGTGSSEIKIPEAFFNYVSDKAEIEGNLLLQRSTNDTSEAVFARHIKHDSSVTEPNTWSVQLNNYVDKDKNIFNDYGHAGFIDEMEKYAMASIQITDKTGSNVGVNNDTAQSVGAVGDLGYACGKMGRNTRLTVSFSGTNTAYSVKTTSGHAGGIVGSMDQNAVLTLASVPCNTNAGIYTLSSGYAGGIVGYNDGGIVKLDDSISSYSIGGTISGATGVGGMFGYYRPIFDDPTTTGTETNAGDINLSKYAVTATVNGTGNIGGLFGTLVNKGVSITEAVVETPETRTDSAGGTIRITNGSVSLTHNDGNAANIGGIAGRYEAYSLSETLEITSDSANELSGVTVTSISMDQSYDTYGGAIGCVGTSAYIKFKDFTLSNATGCGSADKYFGGLVGNGDQAFIDAEGITISASNFRGGGAVGSLGNGVLKLSGTVNLSGATPNETVSN